jgi:hypothetical protein
VWVNKSYNGYIMKYKKQLSALLLVIGTFVSLLPTQVNAATITITCTNGNKITIPDTVDRNAACGTSGGAVTPTQTTNANPCPDEGDCAKKTAFGFNCGGTRTDIKENVGISCLFITVINFMSVAVGLAVVGGVTVGGIMYSTSGGSPGKTQQGVKIIVNSLIGLVLWLLLWAIIQFLIPGGVFKS